MTMGRGVAGPAGRAGQFSGIRRVLPATVDCKSKVESQTRAVESFLPAVVPDFARLAPAHMSTMAWEYVRGGAADEHTLRWNEEAFRKLRLRPNFMVDVS